MKREGWHVTLVAPGPWRFIAELRSPAAPIAPADAAACTAILARGSKSFHAASRLLPRRMRGAVTAFYAFCREADDAVDECPPVPRPKIGAGRKDSDWPSRSGAAPDNPDIAFAPFGRAAHDMDAAVTRLRARLDRVYAGGPQTHAVDRALAAAVAHHGVPRALFDALIEGFVWDAQARRYETLSDVYAYSARVAGAVGVVMSLFMNRRAPETLARAADLGVAMQLTNIARDVGEDARMGRVYLPLAWLRDAGLDPDALVRNPSFSPRLGGVIARLLDAADVLYARADSGIAELPLDCRPAITAARLLYADIGREIREGGFDSVSTRHHTRPLRKLVLCGRALASQWTAHALDRSAPLDETRFLIDAV